MMWRSTWKISFVTILLDLSGRIGTLDRIDRLKVFVKKKILEHSNEVSSRRYLYLVSVCIISLNCRLSSGEYSRQSLAVRV